MKHKSLLSQYDTTQLHSSRKDPQPCLTLNIIDNYKGGGALVMENTIFNTKQSMSDTRQILAPRGN
jgi:hypothetical protein